MLVAIVAMDKNGLIGNSEGIPWRSSKDLQYFKKLTMGKKLIVGRTTFDGLPRLEGRSFIVVTKKPLDISPNKVIETISDLSNLDRFIDSSEIYYVIGGGTIYSQLLPYCRYVFLNRISGDYEGDVFFPVDKMAEDFQLLGATKEEDGEITVSFELHKRKETR